MFKRFKIGLRSFIKDILVVYLGYRMMAVWLFGSNFTMGLSILFFGLFLVFIWFIGEKFGVVPKI